MKARLNRMPGLVAGGSAREGRLFRYEGTERITDETDRSRGVGETVTHKTQAVRRTRRRREDGAALVEFALLAPLLILLVLGIIEFGWLFGQYNDVRHGAREGARFAAVDGGTETQIRDRICTAMDGLSAGMTSIEVTLTQVDDNSNGAVELGETGTVTVVAVVSSLSGVPIISSFLPDELSSTIEFRLEQSPSTWSPIADSPCP